MTYLADELITRAFYTSGILGRGFNTISAEQMADGVNLLNDILQDKASELELLPYFAPGTFNTIAQQENYLYPNLLFIDTLTFNQQTLRLSTNDLTRRQFYNTARVDNVYSFPWSYRFERQKDVGLIAFYPIPNAAYEIRFWGKFGLQFVTAATDLSLTYDGFYLYYLRYALAREICIFYDVSFTEEKMRAYNEIRKRLSNESPPDLSIQRKTMFGPNNQLTWAQIIYPQGWTA